MTIRKNFLLDEEIVKHLQEIAKRQNSTQTDVITSIQSIKAEITTKK